MVYHAGSLGRPLGNPAKVQRPLSARHGTPNNSHQQPNLPPMRKAFGEWIHAPDLSIKLSGLHDNETTWNLLRNFKREGTIVFIEIFEENGKRDTKAKIKFSPPPRSPFWNTSDSGRYEIESSDGSARYKIMVSLWSDRQHQNRGYRIESPVKKGTWYEPKMSLWPSSLHIGIMVDLQSMMPLQHIEQNTNPTKPLDLKFEVDLVRKKIAAEFKIAFTDPRSQGATNFVSQFQVGEFDRENNYMFEIPFDQLKSLSHIKFKNNRFGLAFSLESPPRYHRRREDEKSSHSEESLTWSNWDTWYRQTDIVYDPYRLQHTIITLHKERPVIDIGRWTTYLFVFEGDRNSLAMLEEMKKALQDYNIVMATPEENEFRRVDPYSAELWSLIDPPSRAGAADLRKGTSPLPFEVRYQLEVCISRELLNEYNISREFVIKLAEITLTDPTKARNILEYIAGQDKRIYDPTSIFSDKEALAFSPKTEIPHYCAYARKATITPSTIYFSSPTVETTNRVLRNYAKENEEGRFLRVQFTDELLEGRINSSADKQRNDEIYTRVYRTLYNGIQIGDRHYEFLAFGNSQFRENGAYLFCPTEDLSCDDIRNWMGNFSHIKVVAKYAARLGQCFSTTRAINGLSAPAILVIPDIERDKSCFSDGVGKISPYLAQMIAAELGIRSNTAPSAFQFRLGGCKGILVVSPDAKDKEIHIRKSQQKFTATYNGLEIIRCSRFSCATLNRQTIAILSSLGVGDKVFLDMMTEQLSNYQNAMSDDDLAVSLLLRYIDDTQMTINIATMIRNGFMAQRDPFVLSLLHLWRAWSIKLLKEKAKIIVEQGAFVLGCVDETGILRGYNKPTVAYGGDFPLEELPQIFLQVPDKDDPARHNVIEGICLVGRNPSLHPGDLRVVQAINVPELHHLRDVVVFPSTGERDVPSMCSGGDLDGDDYFVIWDEKLMPTEWNCEPMDYEGPSPTELSRPVEVTDLMKFFVRFMKNDALPTIAHAHLALSDLLSVKDPKCKLPCPNYFVLELTSTGLELAALHSKAVDYVKTGLPAEMPKRLKPRKWPHFMEKKYKPKEAIYPSHKVLGQLYDKVESVDFVPQYEEPFDRRILSAYKLDNSLLKTARQIKSQYDTAMRRILAQQEIKTEFEVWTTFVLSKPRVGSDYKVQEEMARISEALKEQFRAVCIEKAGGKDFSTLGPFVAGMYKVTKEEMDIALAECKSTKIVGGREVPKRKMEPRYMPLITFPWLFEKELGRIATGDEAVDDLEDLGLQPVVFQGTQTGKRNTAGQVDTGDFIRQEDGLIVHRGEELDLFRNDAESEDLSGESDFEEARYLGDDRKYTVGKSGETVLVTAFSEPSGDVSGTGVEDVVPRTVLDGFVDPREMAHGANSAGKGAGAINEFWPQSQASKPTTAHDSGRSSTPRSLVGEGAAQYPFRPGDEPVPTQGPTRKSPFPGDLLETGDAPSQSPGPLSPLISTPSLSSDSTVPNSEPEEAQGDFVVEEVRIVIRESPLEKLARMQGS
ncbi:RNA-dependent RNA polymerase [Lachnellula suecica]|uniref:RNA-dependent RNA polymerase n=1 Tax=Lachnellula suecica TaxID=602035 RepID=A0A8T9BT45_9HELO|nr:RNA-dependent RNA polymerase [Lachnellula suecica]